MRYTALVIFVICSVVFFYLTLHTQGFWQYIYFIVFGVLGFCSIITAGELVFNSKEYPHQCVDDQLTKEEKEQLEKWRF